MLLMHFHENTVIQMNNCVLLLALKFVVVLYYYLGTCVTCSIYYSIILMNLPVDGLMYAKVEIEFQTNSRSNLNTQLFFIPS